MNFVQIRRRKIFANLFSVSKTRLLVYLDSDFAVLYSCTETVPYKMESVWVLASRREYSRDTFYYSIEPRLKRKGTWSISYPGP